MYCVILVLVLPLPPKIYFSWGKIALFHQHAVFEALLLPRLYNHIFICQRLSTLWINTYMFAIANHSISYEKQLTKVA